MKAQGGGVARQGHHASRSGLDRQAGPVLGLAGMATPSEVDPRREPFDGRLSADPHKRRQGDRQPDHDKNQAGRAEGENTDERNEGCRSQGSNPGTGEPEKHPTRWALRESGGQAAALGHLASPTCSLGAG